MFVKTYAGPAGACLHAAVGPTGQPHPYSQRGTAPAAGVLSPRLPPNPLLLRFRRPIAGLSSLGNSHTCLVTTQVICFDSLAELSCCGHTYLDVRNPLSLREMLSIRL